MTTFDNREQAFEGRFVHDQEMEFKAIARRNKLLGLWAAAKLGLAGEAAESYAQEVVRADFEEPGDSDVARKLRNDLDRGQVAVSDAELAKTMADLLVEARRQVLEG